MVKLEVSIDLSLVSITLIFLPVPGAESDESFGAELGDESDESFGAELGDETDESFGAELGEESAEASGAGSREETGESCGPEVGEELEESIKSAVEEAGVEIAGVETAGVETAGVGDVCIIVITPVIEIPAEGLITEICPAYEIAGNMQLKKTVAL